MDIDTIHIMEDLDTKGHVQVNRKRILTTTTTNNNNNNNTDNYSNNTDSSDGFYSSDSSDNNNNNNNNDNYDSDANNSIANDGQPVLHLIGIGFGPASLAIAINIEEYTEKYQKDLRIIPRIKFLEKQKSFKWHSGMLIPSARMQISFLKDFATIRNPRSRFTFLNYLHEQNRLLPFINTDTFLPYREDYENYMNWCAGFFNDQVNYDRTVIKISPVFKNVDVLIGGRTDVIRLLIGFQVTSKDFNENLYYDKAYSVVLAVGGQPHFPKFIANANNERRRLTLNDNIVIHSSEYMNNSKLFTALNEESQKSPTDNDRARVAVIGSGQSAAEIFNHISQEYPNINVDLIIRSFALKPSDDSPFVNEVFNPEMVDSFYNYGEDIKASIISDAKSTNYSVVRLNLIEEIYNKMYRQNLPGHRKNMKIMNFTEIRNYVLSEKDCDRISLILQNKTNGLIINQKYDIVVCATGYTHNLHKELLSGLEGIYGSPSTYSPSRCYQLKQRPNPEYNGESIRISGNVGIWLQGVNERTHGLSDTLLSVMAVRGKEVTEDIFNIYR